jgi:hypothetical protein
MALTARNIMCMICEHRVHLMYCPHTQSPKLWCTRDQQRRCADPRHIIAGFEVLALVDFSLAIKASMHFMLCAGTICKLGTQARKPLLQPCVLKPARLPESVSA